MLDHHLLTALASKNSATEDSPSRVFPLPCFNGQSPVLLVFNPADLAIGVAYAKHPVPGGALVRATTRETTLYCIPQLTPVLAVSDGVVMEARAQDAGDHRVVLLHHNWLSVYGGLTRLFVPATGPDQSHDTRVHAGDILGCLAPTRDGPLKPLELEMWRIARVYFEQIDPIRHMRGWQRVAWKGGPDIRSARIA